MRITENIQKKLQINWKPLTRKTAGTAENPAANKFAFCDIQIKVAIICRQIYIYIPYRSATTQNLSDLTLPFQGHSNSNLIVPLDFPYMASY